MQQHVDTFTQKLDDVVAENKRIEAALISNNEDEHNTNLLFGEALERAEKAEKYAGSLERNFNNAIIGFTVCGTGIGVGSSIMTEGIIKDDITKVLTGVSIDLASLGIWCLCHYVFKIF